MVRGLLLEVINCGILCLSWHMFRISTQMGFFGRLFFIEHSSIHVAVVLYTESFASFSLNVTLKNLAFVKL